MKSLILLFTFLIISTSVRSELVEIIEHTETVNGDPGNVEYNAYLIFKNNNEQAITLKSKVTKGQYQENFMMNFCYGDPLQGGQCYFDVQEGFEPTILITLQPGEVSDKEWCKPQLIDVSFLGAATGISEFCVELADVSDESSKLEACFTFFIGVTGVASDLVDVSEKLYPNPSQSLVTLDGIEGNFDIEIYTNAGAFQNSINSNGSFDIGSFSAGSYYGLIRQGGKYTSVVRFLKL